jgi:hypothetical protein
MPPGSWLIVPNLVPAGASYGAEPENRHVADLVATLAQALDESFFRVRLDRRTLAEKKYHTGGLTGARRTC